MGAPRRAHICVLKDPIMRMTSHLNAVKLVVVSLALAALAACTNTFNADVTHFNSQLPPPSGQTFIVVPENPALAGGIEFQQYASRVADHLAALGYRPGERSSARGPAGAVRLWRRPWARTGDVEPRLRLRPVLVAVVLGPGDLSHRHGARIGYAPFGGPWGWGWYDPFFGGEDIDSYTVYTSGIDLKIERAADRLQAL